MSNLAISKRFTDFPVVDANGITTSNTWVLIQDNLPNANGEIGNTYRATPKEIVAAAGNVQIATSNTTTYTAPAVSRRWIDFPVVVSNVSISNTWVLAQDNLPNSNGGTGHTFRLNPQTIVQSGANSQPLQLYVANSVVNLPQANLYPSCIALVANASTNALSVYSSNGSEWSTAQGSGGGDAFFRFNKSQANSVWNINHGLNKYPSVTVVDTAGTQGFGTVSYIDSNNVTVSFSAAFAGTAYLN